MSITLGRTWMALVVLATVAMAGWSGAGAAASPPHHLGAIAGTVRDTQGHPVHHANVTLEDAQHHVIANTTSNEQGHFHFPHVHPGHYTVRAVKPQVGHGSAPADVQAGHTTIVNIVLH